MGTWPIGGEREGSDGFFEKDPCTANGVLECDGGKSHAASGFLLMTALLLLLPLVAVMLLLLLLPLVAVTLLLLLVLLLVVVQLLLVLLLKVISMSEDLDRRCWLEINGLDVDEEEADKVDRPNTPTIDSPSDTTSPQVRRCSLAEVKLAVRCSSSQRADEAEVLLQTLPVGEEGAGREGSRLGGKEVADAALMRRMAGTGWEEGARV